jgi:hypothetical protein
VPAESFYKVSCTDCSFCRFAFIAIGKPGASYNCAKDFSTFTGDAPRAFLYAIAYHALGRERESDAALQELVAKYPTHSAYQIAGVYAFRNQSDEAFEWLDRAYVQRDDELIETKVDPLLKSLHNDPRYAAFLKKLNLPT